MILILEISDKSFLFSAFFFSTLSKYFQFIKHVEGFGIAKRELRLIFLTTCAKIVIALKDLRFVSFKADAIAFTSINPVCFHDFYHCIFINATGMACLRDIHRTSLLGSSAHAPYWASNGCTLLVQCKLLGSRFLWTSKD